MTESGATRLSEGVRPIITVAAATEPAHGERGDAEPGAGGDGAGRAATEPAHGERGDALRAGRELQMLVPQRSPLTESGATWGNAFYGVRWRAATEPAHGERGDSGAVQ